MTFGERLKKLRTDRKLSQQELSNRIGINRATYARYETDDNQPDFDTLKKLANFFGVTTDYLLTGKTDNDDLSDLSPEDRAILEKIKNDPDLDLFFKDFASAPEEHQRDLIKIWKALHGEKEGK